MGGAGTKRRGPGPSHLLITPDHAGNVVGIDPHKNTLSATVVDPRGGILAFEHFRVSGEGHRALEAWARQFGQVARWGGENAAGWGRHTAIFLAGRGHDVRDVCVNRTPRQDRARQRGKSDTLDCERIAREVLAHSLLPKAFKRAGQDQGPDELHQLLALWHNRRRSILASRQHLVNEAEHLLCELPLELRDQLPTPRRSGPGLPRSAEVTVGGVTTRLPRLRLQLLDGYRQQIQALDVEEKHVVTHLQQLVEQNGSRLGELCGLSTRSVAELLVEVGDPRRFTEGGFARFNGTAPLPALTATTPAATDGHPVQDRVDPLVFPRFAGHLSACGESRSEEVSMPRTKPPFPPEFRREAVKLMRDSDKPLAQLAKDLGVSGQTLRTWRKQEQVNRGELEGISSEQLGELRRLRRENRTLAMEREVLKKARLRG